jgi:hypothetical protein
MKTDIHPKTENIDDSFRRINRMRLDSAPASLILLVGPRSLNTTMMNAIARLGEGGASVSLPGVRVLDGGNRFNAYIVARAARGRPDILNNITISRAFTCYQVCSLLETTPAIPVPFVVLDLLNTFYDESVQVGERKRLLQTCIVHLERLVGAAGGIVSVHPPKVASQAAVELLEMVKAATADTYFIQPVASAAEPMRLFQ